MEREKKRRKKTREIRKNGWKYEKLTTGILL